LTHAIFEDRIGFILSEDPPPSTKRLMSQQGGRSASNDDGWHGGCSVCALVAIYNPADWELVLELPDDMAPPSELNVDVLVEVGGETRRFHAGDDAIAALLSSRSASCYLPLPRTGPLPSRVTLSCTYRQGDVTETVTVTATIKEGSTS
jgi:hypothetical protein